MTTNTTERRDDELGALLRSLDTPGHGPAFEDTLRRRLAAEAPAARRPAVRRWAGRAAALGIAATVVVVAVVAIGGGPPAATAATVRAAVDAAYASLDTMTGTLTADGKHWRFALDSTGDFRLEGPTTGEVITYDARLAEARSAQKSASLSSDTLFYADRVGVAPGPPDQGPPTWLLPEQFGAFVRAALAVHDARVAETTFHGRPSWTMDVEVAPNSIVPDASGDHFSITVDRETGMPAQVVELRGPKPVHELAIDDLTVNQPLDRGVFRLAFPAGAAVLRSDDGFRRAPLDGVAGMLGYRPLIPTDIPAGYHLQEVAVSRIDNVASLRYADGLDEFVVTTRTQAGNETTDPFQIPGLAGSPTAVRLERGALAGADAHVVVAPTVAPHLWAVTDALLVTVSGDLDRAQLVAVANSFVPRGGR
jgi:outer membrane lipoprotein-sorting protein